MPTTKAKNTKSNVVDRISSIFLYKDRLLKRCDKLLMEKPPYHGYYIVKIWEVQSSPNLCVHSSSSYVSPSMLPLSSGDLIEWSLVCHSTLSYQKFCDRHSNHYDHPEELHQSVE